jgi:amidohydrolase
MDLAQAKREACAAVDALADELLGVSHAIHGEPELAFEEKKAAARLCAAVARHDIAVTPRAYGVETAFAAEFGGIGPTVAILSEYDALPGIGHSCGHNIIAAAGLGAALALSKLKGLGRVRYLGTPAEERHGGKEFMAQAGAFEKADAAMMVHPANYELVTMPCMAVSEVEVVYHGRAAHASAVPYRGLNALDGVVFAYQAIAALRQHIKQSERLHGIITEGGLAPNIVPERAACRFYVRAAEAGDLAKLKKRVEACFEAGALASGTRAAIRWSAADYLDLKTSGPLAEAYAANATALGRAIVPQSVLPPGYAGSTDMGNVSHRVPSIHPMLAIAPTEVPIHNAEFARFAVSAAGDKAVLDGAKALAMTALDVMGATGLAQDAAREFALTAEASRGAVAHAFHRAEAAGCGCR